MTSGERLKRHREASGLTQPELAKKAGVNKETVNRWELGAKLSSRKMEAIVAAMGFESYEAFILATVPDKPSHNLSKAVSGSHTTTQEGTDLDAGAPVDRVPQSIEADFKQLRAILTAEEDQIRHSKQLLDRLEQSLATEPTRVPRHAAPARSFGHPGVRDAATRKAGKR